MGQILSNLKSSILLVAATSAIQSVQNIIGKTIGYLREKYDDLSYFKVEFDPKEDIRCKTAVFEEIKRLNLQTRQSILRVTDGDGVATCSVRNRIYYLNDRNIGSVSIDVSDDKITLRACKIPLIRSINDNKYLLDYLNRLYEKYNAAERIMIYYTPEGDRWIHPIIREPRNFGQLTMTKSMNQVLDNIEKFKQDRNII